MPVTLRVNGLTHWSFTDQSERIPIHFLMCTKLPFFKETTKYQWKLKKHQQARIKNKSTLTEKDERDKDFLPFWYFSFNAIQNLTLWFYWCSKNETASSWSTKLLERTPSNCNCTDIFFRVCFLVVISYDPKFWKPMLKFHLNKLLRCKTIKETWGFA